MELIETIQVGAGGAASIEFVSIPSDADDLCVLVAGRATGNDYAATLLVQCNGVTTTNYDYIYLTGYNQNVQPSASTSTAIRVQTQIPGALAAANTFGTARIYFTNYANSSVKAVSIDTASENNAPQAAPGVGFGLYNLTAPITAIKIFHDSGNFAQYSTASLYKITKA